MRAGLSWRERGTEFCYITAPDRKLRSYLRAPRCCPRVFGAKRTRGRQDRDSSHRLRSLRLKHLDSKARKRPGHLQSGPAVRTRGRSWDAIHRVHSSPFQDQGRGKAHRSRSWKSASPRRHLCPRYPSWDRRESRARGEQRHLGRGCAVGLHFREHAFQDRRVLAAIAGRRAD